MIEGLIEVGSPRRQFANERKVEGSLEDIALAGATAIQRIIADRDSLRAHNAAQQRDLAALSAINENLRCRLTLIRQHYLSLGTKILKQLEQFDQVTREAIANESSAPVEVAPPVDKGEDNNLVEIARRFRPESAIGHTYSE
jgi:hypothetical protein